MVSSFTVLNCARVTQTSILAYFCINDWGKTMHILRTMEVDEWYLRKSSCRCPVVVYKHQRTTIFNSVQGEDITNILAPYP